MAKASSIATRGLAKRANATTAIAIEATKSLFFVLVVDIDCFIHTFDTIEKIYWNC